MPDTRLVLVIHSSHLRTVSENEIRAALSPDVQAAIRRTIEVDTTPFEADVEGGVWDDSNMSLRHDAARIREAANEVRATHVAYFGLGEIPHVLALGAYVGDEWHIDVHDHHRDTGKWSWPSDESTLLVETVDLPSEHVEQAGVAVIRVEISRSISDSMVDAVVGRSRLADVKVRVAHRSGGQAGADYGIVRSRDDVAAIRQAVRRGLAAIAEHRPGVDMIHLFVAAPVSASFAIGQELHLRNNVPIQTYRFRRDSDGGSYRDAILLTSEDAADVGRHLTAEEAVRAAFIRSDIWPRALKSVQDYARERQEDVGDRGGPWYSHLHPHEALAAVRPFPPLPSFWHVAKFDDTVDPEPFSGEYGHDLTQATWRLSDALLTGLDVSAAGDDRRLEELIRLFLFHEYVHRHHSLTKYTAEEVGKFANCLERIDYGADLYALFHQLDFAVRRGPNSPTTELDRRAFLVDQIDLMIRSFWAFEPRAPINRWQVRRIRRYLNWYWRQVQFRHAPDLVTAVHSISHPPSIEVAGLEYRAGGRRVYVRLDRYDVGSALEMALVLEDERLLRLPTSVTVPIPELLDAFRTRGHDQIGIFFERVFELARSQGGALPERVDA